MKKTKKIKLKIKNSVAKRFKVTKTGKVMFEHQYRSHKRGIKSKSRLRRQKEPGIIEGRFAKKIKMLLGV
ncbi:MAG: 50S ribosomal protein L35 [Candidatus Levybacteria bacterium]|nr:50S ribosomal protein L35 [Candidatus Levybacteria bacterium]